MLLTAGSGHIHCSKGFLHCRLEVMPRIVRDHVFLRLHEARAWPHQNSPNATASPEQSTSRKQNSAYTSNGTLVSRRNATFLRTIRHGLSRLTAGRGTHARCIWITVRAVWQQQERQPQQEAVLLANTIPKSTTHHTYHLQLVNRASSTYSKANTAQACVLYYVADVYPESIWP